MSEDNDSPSFSWDIFYRTVAITFLPWSIWITVSIFEAKSFQEVTRSNRFTMKDAHDLQKEMLKQHQATQQAIWKLESELTSAFVRHSELEGIFKQQKNDK